MTQEYYAIDLPGKILYNKEFNISIRRITPIEQKYILSLSQKQQKTNQDYIDFIKKLIQFSNPEMTFEELYWFDVQYILYRIRFTTYPKYPIKLTFKCDNVIDVETDKVCNEKVTVPLDMGDLQIITPDDLGEIKKTIMLSDLGETKIRNKIIKDDITIDEFTKKNKIDITDPQMRLLLLDLCLISTDYSLEELYKFAEEGKITAEDIYEIEEWFKNNIWGVKEEINTKCPKCGKEESKAYLLALEDFFSIV